MNTSKCLASVGLLLLLLMLAIPVLAQSQIGLARSVVSGGGTTAAGTGNYRLSGTLGQPVAGMVTAPSGQSLGSGFWGGGPTGYKVFLPLVLK
jgi:hypothetical protein